jgi:transcription initiation factor TFIIE subunit beta
MDYKDLKDSYSKLSSAVEELAGEGQILVVRNKDGNPRVLFHNNSEYNTTIDPGKSKSVLDRNCFIINGPCF